MQEVPGSDRVTTEEREKGSDRTVSTTGSNSKRISARRGDSVKPSGAKPKNRQKGGKKATATKATATKATKKESGRKRQSVVKAMPPLRLQEKMNTEVGPALMSEFSYTSTMQIPGLSKVVLNMGLGEALENPKALENAIRDLTLIAGQKPMTTRAKKSIAAFKVREDMVVGLAVTLRGRRMFEFVERLISAALPRIRDFQGVSRKAFDGRGNYSLGIREQIIFPEIDYNSIDRLRGFQVVIGTTARTDREGFRLLELLGMPFARAGDATRAE